jgi:hypothetical protein
MKKILFYYSSYDVCSNWKTIQDCLIEKAFKDNLYFHEYLFDGEKGIYSKISNGEYEYQKNNYREVRFRLYQKSLIYKPNLE